MIGGHLACSQAFERTRAIATTAVELDKLRRWRQVVNGLTFHVFLVFVRPSAARRLAIHQGWPRGRLNASEAKDAGMPIDSGDEVR